MVSNLTKARPFGIRACSQRDGCLGGLGTLAGRALFTGALLGWVGLADQAADKLKSGRPGRFTGPRD
jgi:hypothetical protein